MKIAKIAGIVVAVLFLLVLVFAATFDIGKYKSVIETKAKDATGRTVSIGDIRLAASLTPTITLLDVKVANAPWGTRAEMATIKRVDVAAELLPLLHGQVKIAGLSLDTPDLWLETDARGRGNWDMSAPAAKKTDAPASSAAALRIGGVDIKGLTLAYKDRERSATVAAKTLAVKGELQDTVVRSLELAGVTFALKQGKDEIGGAIGKATLDAGGKIADLGITNLALSDVTVTRKGEGAPLDAAVSKLTVAQDGRVLLIGSVNGQDVRAAGTLAPIAVLAALNKPFPAKLTIDGMGLQIQTDLQVAVAGGRPAIKGTVAIPALDLAPAKVAKGEAAREPARAPAQASTQASAQASERVFSDAPLPWSSLTAADADIQVSIAKASLPSGLTLTNVAVPIDLAKGRLAVDGLKASVAGGTIAGSLTATAADKSVSLKLEGTGLSAESIAKEMKKGDLITQGPLDIHIDVHGRGASLHNVMASLDGSLLAGMGESRIKNSDLNLMGGDLLQLVSAVNPVGNQDPYTVARCGVVNFKIADGVARTNNGIALVTDKMQLTSSGTVNLGSEQIDLALNPKATGGLGVGLGALAQAVKVSGPLAKPGIGIDKAGAAKTIGALGMAFATGGTSLLAQGAKDRMTGGDACQAARKMSSK
jgi:hypothetical protein